MCLTHVIAMAVNTHSFESIRGSQAGSDFYIAMCTLKSVSKLFTFKDAEIPAEQRAQRTLRKSRIPKIRDYILQNPADYTFSSLTVSVDGKITFEPTSKSHNVGTISISQDAVILINDGQHRVAAIKEAVAEYPELGRHQISVVFFEDLDLKKSQQMFADLNKHAVKPTKSLGILYDRRNDFASFVVEMINDIQIFKNRIEMEKTSITPTSAKFFTLNAIEHATRYVLDKSKNISEKDKAIVIKFWNEVAKNIPEWVNLMQNNVSPAELRKDFVHANTNMLEAIAMAGHTMIKKHPDSWKSKLAGLQSIDWTRSNPEWDGNIVIKGKMSKTKAGMSKASKIILKHCGGT